MTEAEITKTKETFKPIFLYIDEMSNTRLTKMYLENIELNNIAILEAENLLKKKLTKKEIQSLLKDVKAFSVNLKSSIIDTFQFPNATTEFNLSALGLSFKDFDIAINNIHINNYSYLVDAGEVKPEPKQLKLIEEQNKIYTKSQRQNIAFGVAENLVKSGNTLLELKITYSDTQHHLSKATNQLVKWAGNNTLQINHHKILSL
jgi:hypothetical protein